MENRPTKLTVKRKAIIHPSWSCFTFIGVFTPAVRAAIPGLIPRR